MIYFAIYSIFVIFMNCTTLDTEYNEIQRYLKGFVVSQKAIARYYGCIYRNIPTWRILHESRMFFSGRSSTDKNNTLYENPY